MEVTNSILEASGLGLDCAFDPGAVSEKGQKVGLPKQNLPSPVYKLLH